MNDFLQRIERYKREEIRAAKAAVPAAELVRRSNDVAPPRGFRAALCRDIHDQGTALIAEVKKASPSKGLIRSDFDPPALARAYAAGGATCLSVLTDAPSFQGSPEHLSAVHDAVALPSLRKDFLFDPYQVLPARAWGADCVLVILAAVDDATAADLEDTALGLGMDVLLEVHDEAEMARAAQRRSRLIGINNRTLRSFTTSLTTTERLAPAAPPDVTLISESGITGTADTARLRAAGVAAFLVGESLMRQDDVEAATRSLLTGQPADTAAGAR
jgi:indole-3-glycerol phosphate synthase